MLGSATVMVMVADLLSSAMVAVAVAVAAKSVVAVTE